MRYVCDRYLRHVCELCAVYALSLPSWCFSSVKLRLLTGKSFRQVSVLYACMYAPYV